MTSLLVLLFITSTLTDQVTAFVGDEVILESMVQENMYFLSNDPATRQMFSTDDELRAYVLNELISQKLILAEAERESISVGREELANIVDERINEIKERYPSEADFLEDLAKNDITIEQLKEFNQENLRAQLLMQRLIEKKTASRISVSPIAAQRFYDENKDSIAILPARVKLAHILLSIKPSEAASKEGFAKALDVYKLLLTGGDFSVIAQEFSDDGNTRKQGGMLGKIQRGQTVEEFERVVFELKPGTISQPFPTRYGYHIVEVLNKGSDWVLARQILIRVEATKADTTSCERHAMKLRELAMNGADFDSLARIYSDDPNIDIGEFYENMLTPPFDEVVKGLKEGELSEPLLTPYGYHLIYVRQRVPEQVRSFEEMRTQIYQYLSQQMLQEQITRLIEELKERTFVTTFARSDL